MIHLLLRIQKKNIDWEMQLNKRLTFVILKIYFAIRLSFNSYFQLANKELKQMEKGKQSQAIDSEKGRENNGAELMKKDSDLQSRGNSKESSIDTAAVVDTSPKKMFNCGES